MDNKTNQEIAAQAIKQTLKLVEVFLLGKNEAYGNSAFEPVRCFSSANPKEQIAVRMDDKISRLLRGNKEKETENVKEDLLGYLVLDAAYDRYQELVAEYDQSIPPALEWIPNESLDEKP